MTLDYSYKQTATFPLLMLSLLAATAQGADAPIDAAAHCTTMMSDTLHGGDFTSAEALSRRPGTRH